MQLNEPLRREIRDWSSRRFSRRLPVKYKSSSAYELFTRRRRLIAIERDTSRRRETRKSPVRRCDRWKRVNRGVGRDCLLKMRVNNVSLVATGVDYLERSRVLLPFRMDEWEKWRQSNLLLGTQPAIVPVDRKHLLKYYRIMRVAA